MDYFEKVEQKPTPDLTWNLPEQKSGSITIAGGNSNNFRIEVKAAEFILQKYSLEKVILIFPDSLKSKLPGLPNVIYSKSTDSGSFGDPDALNTTLDHSDFDLILGDLSKNAITAQIFSEALKIPARPTLVTRDTIDLIAENDPEPILKNPRLIFFASMPQLQKLFRAVYYPKMILLSQSIVQVSDALHKFTLSYPAKVITLHNDQILLAENGEVKSVPLTKSGYPPLTFWQGELAAKIAVLNLYNPNNFLPATLTAIFS